MPINFGLLGGTNLVDTVTDPIKLFTALPRPRPDARCRAPAVASPDPSLRILTPQKLDEPEGRCPHPLEGDRSVRIPGRAAGSDSGDETVCGLRINSHR
jgi:hypothetical protein